MATTLPFSNHNEYFETDFRKISFIDSALTDVTFEECEFVDCDFSHSKFTHCRFINCRFERSNLSLVNISYCRLFSVSFGDCKLVGIDWTQAEWPTFYADHELQFKQCLLNDSSFFGLTLNALVLDECKLHDVDFREASLCDSNMRWSDFTGSLFGRTNLTNCDFSDSQYFTIDVLNNTLDNATFSRFEALNLLESLNIQLVD